MAEYGLKRYFNGECAHRITNLLQNQLPDLDGEEFAAAVNSRIQGLELKDRVMVIAEELRRRLPDHYVTAVGVLVDSLGDELREDQGMFTDSWFLMPVARYVEEYGTQYPHESLDAIEEITKRHTGEYAIRPYLRQWQELTMARVDRWSRSSSHNVRRLASEGIRPRLPWANRFKPFVDDPEPVVQVIDRLIDDPSLYVRTSVANNLNDISKDHPRYAVSTAARWLASSDNSSRTQWIVTKGLRTLIKKGDPAALKVVEAEPDPYVSVQEIDVEPLRPAIGERAEIRVIVANKGTVARDVIVDYQIHFRRSDGTLRPTTFKLGRVTVQAGGTALVRKYHAFKSVKTRTLHPGRHGLVAQANGSQSRRIGFDLLEARGA